MPSVLTDEGYVVFNTQEEADEFRKQKGIEQEPEKEPEKEEEKEDESPSGFMKSLRKTFKKKGA